MFRARLLHSALSSTRVSAISARRSSHGLNLIPGSSTTEPFRRKKNAMPSAPTLLPPQSRAYGIAPQLSDVARALRRSRAFQINLEEIELLVRPNRMVVQLDYEIVKATEKDALAVLDYMLEDFLYTEPLNAAVDLKPEEARVFFSEIVEAGLSCPVNYVVKNEKGEVVGLRWSCISRREDAATDYTFESNSPYWKIQEIQRLLHTVESKVWDLLPHDINCLLSLLIISVHKDYTRRGIAGKLINHRLDELQEIGCQAIATTASANASQQLFKRLGFEELYAVHHEDWRDEKGNVIFNCQDGTSKASLVVKRL